MEAVPFRPLPPPQAAYDLQIPRVDAAGVRQTVNTGLDENETLWHFRSGWNVAALNCQLAADDPILTGYSALLTSQSRALSRANTAIDRKFRQNERTDRAALLARETHSTGVYNYFANPSARADFCAAAREVASEFLATPPQDIAAFATAGLQRYEQAFNRFYVAYEQYEQLSAEWDRKWGAQYGPSQPGWVALYGDGTRTPPGEVTAEATGFVLDPDSGAEVPVIPVDETVAATPVVQPVPTDAQ
ncbi:hypothetical protein D2V17_08430 [Aurantiacibacter xanthus]|uniref:Uncharacterized protein n=1 Tax=Aurantiacibacter xanthus TaxID=1784712 RepID=A0A3A1P4M4_9SPHN|nr:hypothetical protein D2V17_08430 [Aurantiacibacter xanthus]